MKEDISVFDTESKAAYHDAINRPAPKPIAKLYKDSTVTVIYDTYGKDYWACRVELPNKIKGWVLCTYLTFTQSN
ncbi:hypothetical protein JF50_17935 [Pseudoalteromonas luteoviolacea]|uniref:SH3 domain-containing protein n=1 Tax=Pseudoalteromonas luteoviolacea TaxID=43657 RepID=A0A0C1Q6C4_9GAMM|nr:SH3 domain-containing protein [Pseudoalteromonas luteoviolacea]KID56161.1 hypothetical protein JF50_17935 [Pseudoalteromonas luteoviolacea]